MTDGIPPTPQLPPVVSPAPPAQPVVSPAQLGHVPQLNWMDIHAFWEGFKVQRFCLTIVGKARL